MSVYCDQMAVRAYVRDKMTSSGFTTKRDSALPAHRYNVV
jgi:hypothetical protein